MGYDAFGLPTENYAIKNHIHPAKVTHDNVANFRAQLQMLGYSFDWDREVNTTDPNYYKWTQWIFLQMFKKGLAYKASMAVLPLCVYREPALVAAAKMVWFDAIPKLSFAESLLAVLCKEHIFRADEQPTEEY